MRAVLTPARQLVNAVIFGSLLAIVAALPFVLHLPIPQGTAALSEARLTLEGGPEQTVTLPHRWPVGLGARPASAHYEIGFTLAEIPEDGNLLLFPAIRQYPKITLNGALLQSDDETAWFSPSLGGVYLLTLPRALLIEGENRLEITLERRSGNIPGYLSKAYLGDKQTITPRDQIFAFFPGYIRAAAYPLLALALVGILVVWTARPRDPIFGWLAAAAVINLSVAIIESDVLGFQMADIQPYLFSAFGVFGVLATGIALALVDRPRPGWLKWLLLAIPLLGPGAALSGVLPVFPIALSSVAIALLGHLYAIFVLGGDFVRNGRWENGLLAVPFFITVWLGLHDVGIPLGLVESGFLLSSYVRSLVVVCVIVILMRRLAVTLNQIDRAKETLKARLAERESELSMLHEKEQQRTAEAVREEERQRLMRDLHDGVSGHLISIIALAERGPEETGTIEKAAREALDDLRLVINSLDMGDRDLPLALAAFRERISRQLRRLDIDLVWSMDRLPEVSGLTPATALFILRILQEAVTNAIKHGPATRIAITATAGPNQTAILVIDNDGESHTQPGKGHGLGNMVRRAKELGGSVALTPITEGMRLTLTLPRTLPASAA